MWRVYCTLGRDGMLPSATGIMPALPRKTELSYL